jgi:hypothetical protein
MVSSMVTMLEAVGNHGLGKLEAGHTPILSDGVPVEVMPLRWLPLASTLTEVAF